MSSHKIIEMMKKILLSMAVALVGSGAAFAQHAGQAGLGVNIGVVPVIEGEGSPTNFTLGARVQYSATDLIRLNADFNYGFKDNFISTFDATANVNFMVPLSQGFYLYPLAGLGYGNINVDLDEFGSTNLSRFVFNVGLGAEYEFNPNFAAGLEFKYRYMKDYGSLPVMLNFSYKF